MGQVIGIDFGTTIALSQAHGMASPIVTDLLEAAEDGVVQAFAERMDSPDGP